MLITFKTKAYANITMFGDVGLRMIKMMDFGTSVPGAIREQDVPQALTNLQQSLALMPQQVAPAAGEAEEEEPPVSLHVRAAPLLELLRRAIKGKTYVSWE